MSKVTTMLMVMSGVSLLFYLTGILSGTATSTLLSLVLNPGGWQTTSTWLTIAGVITAVTAAGAIALVRGTTIPDYVALTPIVVLLFAFGWDFLVVYQKLSESGGVAGGVFALLLFGPLMLMYVLSVIEWWRTPG